MKIENKTLLITGGTGSFGHAVLNRFLHTNHFSEIRIFSRDEKKQDDMRNQLKSDKLKFYIGDVRDYDSVERAMRGVDYVFHAAALKQVPSCEFFPLEATKTNVFGTQNVIDAAGANKVKKVICLSTDKAAYPINAMGISKALMEKVAIAASRDSNETTVCLTRYGNVMASRGSVIPLFLKQIQAGQLSAWVRYAKSSDAQIYSELLGELKTTTHRADWGLGLWVPLDKSWSAGLNLEATSQRSNNTLFNLKNSGVYVGLRWVND